MTREEILKAAEKCVCHDRNQQYGKPEDSFSVIAEFWSAYLSRTIGEKIGVCDVDVAAMMALLKIARIAGGTATEDSWIDLAGYAACGGECDTKTVDKFLRVENRCVVCGEIIPEGRQVCWGCERYDGINKRGD